MMPHYIKPRKMCIFSFYLPLVNKYCRKNNFSCTLILQSQFYYSLSGNHEVRFCPYCPGLCQLVFLPSGKIISIFLSNKALQATYIGETGRNLNVRLTEHKRATRNGDINNHIAEHHLQTNHRIDWDSAKCITYCTNYYQRLTLESWFTNLEQSPLNRCLQLPAPYKRLIDNNNETDKQ